MSKRRAWEPLRPASPAHPNENVLALARDNAMVAQTLRDQPREMWWNRTYTVIVYRAPNGNVAILSIRRNDRRPESDWRDLQRIKNQLAGEETEAVNLHPRESRMVDAANQTWLWVMPPGMTLPWGFNEGRLTGGKEQAEAIGARQRPGDTRVVARAPDGS